MIDWASRKLTTVCRSSPSAEVQTLVAAVDNLEWAKILFGFMIWPSCRPDQEEVMRWLGDSPCIADARALHDASKSKAPGMKLQEKRIAIELKISNDRMQALGGVFWWCNLHQQLADGTTKTSARQQLAATLQKRMRCLRHDPEGTALKNVRQEVRQEEQDTLDQAAKEFERTKMIQDGIYKLEEMERTKKRSRSAFSLAVDYQSRMERGTAQRGITTQINTKRQRRRRPQLESFGL